MCIRDRPKNWGYGDFKGWTRFVQSLFFPCMKERDKRGSARRVRGSVPGSSKEIKHQPIASQIWLSWYEVRRGHNHPVAVNSSGIVWFFLPTMGHFRITLGLFFKASPGAHLFIWKLVLIHMQMKTNFHMKRWAPRLAFKKRLTVIRKWPISSKSLTARTLQFEVHSHSACKPICSSKASLNPRPAFNMSSLSAMN